MEGRGHGDTVSLRVSEVTGKSLGDKDRQVSSYKALEITQTGKCLHQVGAGRVIQSNNSLSLSPSGKPNEIDYSYSQPHFSHRHHRGAMCYTLQSKEGLS